MQQQKPLEGAQLVIMTIALSLATFMQYWTPPFAAWRSPLSRGISAHGSARNVGNNFFGVANTIWIPLTGWLASASGK